MAIFYPNSPNIGVDLNNQSATALFALGTHVLGTQDTEWVYLQANSSISARTMIAFTAAGSAGMASGSDILAGSQLATAQTTVSVSSFFWAAIRGIGLSVLTTGVTTVVAQGIYLAATGGTPTGILSNSISASGTVAGISFTAIADQTATQTYTVATLSWPRGRGPGL
jgi:hypothetical protein